MLDNYAHVFLAVGGNLVAAQHVIYRDCSLGEEKVEYLQPGDEAHDEAMKAFHQADEGCRVLPLGTLSKEVSRAIQQYKDGGIADRIQTELERLAHRFNDELHGQEFKYVPPRLSQFYGQKTPFGEAVATKFPDASEDLENAGNCLALGQNAACMFHLMRAMEVVVRKYARRFDLPVGLNVTWVVLAGNMAAKIDTWPKKGIRNIRRKDKWSNVVSLLRHVGIAWRNPTMHPKKTYTHRQALDAYSAVRTFMAYLAEEV